MKDKLFYPLFVLVVAGIIGVALLPGSGNRGLSRTDILAQGYTLAGADLQKLTTSPGTLADFPNDISGVPTFAVLSANLPQKMAGASAGVFGTLPPNYEQAFAGQTIKVTVSARSREDLPLESFLMAYFTAGAGDSGWRNYALTPDFKDYSFTFAVKKTRRPSG